MEKSQRPPEIIVDAFEYRWTLARDVETLVERTEMRMGVRCADCGLRFHLAGADPDRHLGCVPF